MTLRPAGGELGVGDRVVVEVGPIDHGGHCVARHDGRVLFVRHALPGEELVVEVTEGKAGDRFLRADAVEIRRASPDRVAAPCPYAGPGRCGGCDFQHVALAAQRDLKAAVVREQFAHLARLEFDPVVEELPGAPDGLGWRTRIEYAVGPGGEAGLRPHRSHEVIPIAECLIADQRIQDADVLQRDWSGQSSVDVVAPSDSRPVVVPVPSAVGREPVVQESVVVGGFAHTFEVSARGFWQVHPAAAATFVEVVLGMLDPQPGDRCLDLYAGVGLFAAALADAVTPLGQVIAVESDREATLHAKANLTAYRHALVMPGRVDDLFGVARPKRRGSADRGQRQRKLRRSPLLPERADLVVLDPPRTGAGAGVVRALAGLRARAIAYVACDPAALARDTATFAEHGYTMTRLRCFDAFPMTHHVECIARFEPTS